MDPLNPMDEPEQQHDIFLELASSKFPADTLFKGPIPRYAQFIPRPNMFLPPDAYLDTKGASVRFFVEGRPVASKFLFQVVVRHQRFFYDEHDRE
jgi:hypothetical protein